MTRNAAPELVAPSWHWMPEYGETLGPEVGDVARLAGFTPDPEQQLALDGIFAIRPDGRAQVRDYGICAPRQNLKTGLLKMCALGWLYVTEERLIVWSAHEFGTSQEAFRDMCTLIESNPDLDAEVQKIHYANGDEAIELTGDRRLKFKARTKSGGRGLTGNRIVLDEAMYLRPGHMGSLVPTLRAVRDPQLLLAGSAGMVDSAVWRSYRDRGRAGGDPRLGWLEYADPEPGGCARDDCDHHFGIDGCALDDRARWWATNTALGRRITEDTLEADRRSLPPEEDARETLGWWEDPPDGGGILDLEEWAALTATDRSPARPVFSIEVALDRSRTLIGAGWVHGGKPHVEVVEQRGGTEWVAERLAELTLKYHAGPIVLDAGTEAASLEPDLEAQGLQVVKLTRADRAAACGRFFDAATSGGLTHNGDPVLAEALRSARWKDSEGSRVFSRRGSAGDIAALYAVTFALHGLTTHAPVDPGIYVI